MPATAREFGYRLFDNKTPQAALEQAADKADAMACDGALPTKGIERVAIDHGAVTLPFRAGGLRGLERRWLAIEVVGPEGAAEPPADVSGYKAGQPAADEVVERVPIARRTRLKIDLAGSHASAEAAATASADFDIRVDGVSSATMRFAAAATSATFIAASEAVLEPGQVLSVVAPSTPDATLAGIGFTLAGSLVL